MEFDVFIGLEIHVQLQTHSKMFCACPNHFGIRQNHNVCPVCLGYPGILPVPNMKAIEYSYRIAHALHCTLADTVQFDRKNYYYPDLPKNYQISQFYNPVGRDGYFDYLYNGKVKKIRVHEAHLEEDAGKLIHSADSSYCDYNRTGTPLVEVVTEPELHSAAETEEMAKQFRRMVRYLGVSDGNMEEGSLRCDANVSVNHRGRGLGTKVEIKNVNSFRFVRAALEYEIDRQSRLLRNSTPVLQETRLWNENKDCTESMRTKEIADDYRYFPEPDIRPLKLSMDFFDELQENENESPTQRYLRVQKEYSLDARALDFFIEEKAGVDYFEAVAQKGIDPALVVKWGTGDLIKLYKEYRRPFFTEPMGAERFAAFLRLLQDGVIHGKIAKILLKKIFEEDAEPETLVEKYNLREIEGEELSQNIAAALSEQEAAVKQYREGNLKAFGFLMGEIMKKTAGRANPSVLKTALQKALGAAQ